MLKLTTESLVDSQVDLFRYVFGLLSTISADYNGQELSLVISRVVVEGMYLRIYILA